MLIAGYALLNILCYQVCMCIETGVNVMMCMQRELGQIDIMLLSVIL